MDVACNVFSGERESHGEIQIGFDLAKFNRPRVRETRDFSGLTSLRVRQGTRRRLRLSADSSRSTLAYFAGAVRQVPTTSSTVVLFVSIDTWLLS